MALRSEDSRAGIRGREAAEGPGAVSGGSLRRVVGEGIVAGLCGYATVVLAVTVLDLLSGRAAFHTAAQLGNWLFHPLEDALTGPGWPSALAYNGLHLVLSLLTGIAAAAMVALSERMSGFWYVSLMFLVAFGIYTVGALGAMAVEFKQLIDWATAILGTAAWLGGITVYLWSAHPRLLVQVDEQSVERGG